MAAIAFRRKGRPFMRRRRRSRWDMQTFRECDRQLNVDFTRVLTCNDPQVYADYVMGVGEADTNTEIVQGVSKAVMFGGGHLQVEYHGAFVENGELPCHPSVRVVTALVVLPLFPLGSLSPAYIPNPMITRTQTSVVSQTQADNDEDWLWWWGEQLDLANAVSSGVGSSNCWPANNAASLDGDGRVQVLGSIAALYGRASRIDRVRVKRRCDEKHALFLLTAYAHNTNVETDQTWPVRRSVYLRYAVRQSR